jgi:hypothetical protein
MNSAEHGTYAEAREGRETLQGERPPAGGAQQRHYERLVLGWPGQAPSGARRLQRLLAERESELSRLGHARRVAQGRRERNQGSAR